MESRIYFDGGYSPEYRARALHLSRTHFTHPIVIQKYLGEGPEVFHYGYEHGDFARVEGAIWIQRHMMLYYTNGMWHRRDSSSAPIWAKLCLYEMIDELPMRIFRRSITTSFVGQTFSQPAKDGPTILIDDQGNIAHYYAKGLRTGKIITFDKDVITEDLRWKDSQTEYLIHEA